MSAITPKKPTPEIYAIGDQVAVYQTTFGNTEMIGIYPVDFITAKEAILKNRTRDRIPLKKAPWGKRAGDAWTPVISYKPAEQSDFDELELKNERARAASLIQDLRNIDLTDLDIKAVTALNSALENAIKSIEQ